MNLVTRNKNLKLNLILSIDDQFFNLKYVKVSKIVFVLFANMKIEKTANSDSSETKQDQTELISTDEVDKNLKSSNNQNDNKTNSEKTEVQKSDQVNVDSNTINNNNKASFLETKLKLKNSKANEWQDYHEKLLKVLKKEVCFFLYYVGF